MRNVLVVIVNYRVGELCVEALGALEEQVAGQPGCRAVVVDNDSGDGSPDRIEGAIRTRGWHDWASVVRAPRNLGLSAGNNLAIRPALAATAPGTDYFLILNPDTVPRPGAVGALWEFMEANPRAGIAGSRMEDPDGTPHRSRFRFPNLWNELDSRLGLGVVSRLLRRHKLAPPLVDETQPADWVAGASMLIRREVFEQIGLFDEGYFLYFEDVDFCLRASRADWPCWYVVESRVAHIGGASSQFEHRLKRKQQRIPGYWFESRRRFWVKNHGLAFATLIDVVALAALGLQRLRFLLQRAEDPQPERFRRDLLRHAFFRPDSLRQDSLRPEDRSG